MDPIWKNPSEFAVLLTLANYARGEAGDAYPSKRTIAKHVGLSQRQVWTVTRALEDLGLICIEKGAAKFGGHRYTLLFDPVLKENKATEPPPETVEADFHSQDVQTVEAHFHPSTSNSGSAAPPTVEVLSFNSGSGLPETVEAHFHQSYKDPVQETGTKTPVARSALAGSPHQEKKRGRGPRPRGPRSHDESRQQSRGALSQQRRAQEPGSSNRGG